MKSTGRLCVSVAKESEIFNENMEEEIKEQRKHLETLDYKLDNSNMAGYRKKEIFKSMINFLVEQL